MRVFLAWRAYLERGRHTAFGTSAFVSRAGVSCARRPDGVSAWAWAGFGAQVVFVGAAEVGVSAAVLVDGTRARVGAAARGVTRCRDRSGRRRTRALLRVAGALQPDTKCRALCSCLRAGVRGYLARWLRALHPTSERG